MMRFHALVLLAMAAAVPGQIYVNGPFVTHPGAFAGCATPGDGSEVENLAPLLMTTFGFTASTTFRLADQFQVPAGMRWNISAFKVYGYQTGSGTVSSLTSAGYRIWSGTPGIDGIVIADFSGSNQLQASSWTGAYRAVTANLGACTSTALSRPVMEVIMAGNALSLGPGNYWLDFALAGTLSAGPFVPPITITGLGQTGDARQQIVSTGAWNAIGNSTTYPGPYHQGLPFEVQYTCTPVLLSPPPIQRVPYVPGSSYGPLGSPPDPILDQDQRTYAAAYWEIVDTCGAATSLMQGFQPQSPNWPAYGISSQISTDPDPFGDGIPIFRSIFSHRLQLDPSQGPLFDLNALMAADSWVALQWRFWTLTHQLVTASFLDPVAHNNHIQALIESLTVGIEWGTLGVPYFDASLTVVASEGTKKLRGNPSAPPAPVPLAGLPIVVQNYDAHIRALASALRGNIPALLYDADGNGPNGHVGFDCDDFADAIAARIFKGQLGLTANIVYMSWNLPNCGQAVGHAITKIRGGGYYWLVDAQTGTVDGPHAEGTPVDGRAVTNGYAKDNNKPVTTTDNYQNVGARSDAREPLPWFSDPAQRARFQQITGLDPNCFR